MKRKFDGSEGELGEDTWRGEKGVGSSMERSVPLVVEGDDWGVEGFGGGFHLVRDPGFFFWWVSLSVWWDLCAATWFAVASNSGTWDFERLERKRESLGWWEAFVCFVCMNCDGVGKL